MRGSAQVRVYESAEVGPDWHPKQGVFGKRYVYRIWCGGAAPPSLEPLCWLRPGRHRLNLDAMNQAAELLTGEQDFEELSLDALPSSARGAPFGISAPSAT